MASWGKVCREIPDTGGISGRRGFPVSIACLDRGAGRQAKMMVFRFMSAGHSRSTRRWPTRARCPCHFECGMAILAMFGRHGQDARATVFTVSFLDNSLLPSGFGFPVVDQALGGNQVFVATR